jgi:tetratricopeptide (TPR) repeat protein
MILAATDHRNEEALRDAISAAARMEKILAMPSPTKDERATAFQVFNNIALTHKNQHLYPEAIRFSRRAIDVGRSLPAGSVYLGNPLSVLADALRFSGDLSGALQAIQEASTGAEKVEFRGDAIRAPTLFNVLWRKGVILGQYDCINLERPVEAAAALQQALDLVLNWARQDPDNASSRILTASAARELGRILTPTDPVRALAIDDEAIERVTEIKNNRGALREQARLLAYSSMPLLALRRNAEAKRRIDAAFHLLGETKDYPTDRVDPESESFAGLEALGGYWSAAGQPEAAAAVYRDLLSKVMAFQADPEADLRQAGKLSALYAEMSLVSARTHDTSAPADFAARRIAIWQHWKSKLPDTPYIQHQLAAAQAAN